MTEDQIKHMVNRFLSWKLPENFNPDCGISFKRDYNTATPWPAKHEPVGTNLFTAEQAEAMVRHMIEGLPAWNRRAIDPEMLEALKDSAEILFHLGTAGKTPTQDEAINGVRERVLEAIAKATA